MSLDAVRLDASKVWRVADLAGLDEDACRYEIADGVLEMTPAPDFSHALISANLTRLLLPQLDPAVACLSGAGIQIGRSYREPDLMLIRRPSSVAGALVPAGIVLLAVEVVSPASRRTDRVAKPAEYARAGIPVYLRVEREDPSIVVYVLDDGAAAYRELGTFRPGDVIDLLAPVQLHIEVAAVFG